MKKVMCFAVALTFLTINLNIDDLHISQGETYGKPSWWDKLWSGQIWLDYIYGANKVSVDLWNMDLSISGLGTGYQQAIVKVQKGSVDTLEEDFPEAKVKYLYNTTEYSFITVEMPMEDIAQKFWKHLRGGKETLADKSYG